MDTFGYLGLELEEAKQLLREQGKAFTIKYITPFYKGQERPVEGDFRIVRVREDASGLELTACRIPCSCSTDS